jgi:hypothetical protein
MTGGLAPRATAKLTSNRPRIPARKRPPLAAVDVFLIEPDFI